MALTKNTQDGEKPKASPLQPHTLLQLSKVQKRFGGQIAINGITLSMGAGEVLLILGHNGAGKSTLLRICSGLARPDSGEVLLSGLLPSRLLMGRLPLGCSGYVAAQPMLYGRLTVRENLTLFSRLTDCECAVNELLTTWQLDTVQNMPLSTLSGEMRMRCGLARAWMSKAPLLLLDEPSAPLESGGVALFEAQIQSRVERGSTVIIATHDAGRLLHLATRVILLENAQLVDDSSTAATGAHERRQEIVQRYLQSNR